MATIYEISDKYKMIQSLIENGEDASVFEDALKSIDDELSVKLENYAAVIKNVQSDADGIKSEEERLAKRRKYIENSIVSMKKSMEDAMIVAGQNKIKGEKFNFNIQKNPPSLTVLDENLIPREFFVDKEPTLDRKLLLDSLKAGKEYEGAAINQKESIRIK